MTDIPIEKLLFSNFVKYDRLKIISDRAFSKTNASELNIYIDLNSMLKSIYSQDILGMTSLTSISSFVVNICSHYRHFYRTRYRVKTNIFIVYSENIPHLNSQFYKDYNKNTKARLKTNTQVKDFIYDNIELLKLLVPYLPNIYFVEGTYETGVLINHIIKTRGLNIPNMIISKDSYLFQLVSLYDNTIVLRPKKSNGQDLSYYIHKDNLLTALLKLRNSTEDLQGVSPELASIFMTLTYVKERNIKSLVNVKTAVKSIKDGINDKTLYNGHSVNPTTIWNGLNTKAFNTESFNFECRYKAIDIPFQYSVFVNSPEVLNIRFIDLYDLKALEEINSKYFNTNPLDLDGL